MYQEQIANVKESYLNIYYIILKFIYIFITLKNLII